MCDKYKIIVWYCWIGICVEIIDIYKLQVQKKPHKVWLERVEKGIDWAFITGLSMSRKGGTHIYIYIYIIYIHIPVTFLVIKY